MKRERLILGLLLAILIGIVFSGCKEDPPACTTGDKTELTQAIADAQALHDGVTEGMQPGEYNPGSKEALQTSIDHANEVLKADCVTQSELDAAVSSLEVSVNAFEKHQEIEQYAADNQLNGQFTASGLYYEIIEQGNGNYPTASSTVTVTYKGYYLDGTVLDEGALFTAALSNLIDGWKEGILLISEGGKIILIIPSHLAYKDNKVLAFDVTLHYFSK